MKVQDPDSIQDQNGNSPKSLLSEVFLLTHGFVKTKGQFGEYFFHEKYQLFRCWFHEGDIQVGKKDVDTNNCIWLAKVKNKQEFIDLFRILTKQNLLE